ncbi:MAG: sigma factor, partial [Caldimonas sp.]
MPIDRLRASKKIKPVPRRGMRGMVCGMLESRPRTPDLRIVGAADADVTEPERSSPEPIVKDVDWAILMARAQGGDASSYRRLLDEISPYLRSLAAVSHRDPLDIEDTVQDALLSIHSVRHTYDPARPFGPWLVTI